MTTDQPIPLPVLPTWKATLGDVIREDWAAEIDQFEQQMALRARDQLPEKIFAELRLRRGFYGQRYDNGQRHDGVATRTLDYPRPELTKGPTTLWDAPGMVRIKIPYGALTAQQLDVLADLSEEYSDAIVHVTTRQDIQLHFIHLDDAPDIMRRLAAVGITTREACGNSVRNVTACPQSGCCRTESFDTSPYAHALTFFLLGHPDAQDFGRKMKISFSGCAEEACGLAGFHDLGYVATTRPREDGTVERGFALYVGGGLGAVPVQAELFSAFLPEGEILPIAQAICRVFGRLGEKNNRNRARLKFLVQKLGFDEFKRLVLEERAQLTPDERWTSFLPEATTPLDQPVRDGRELLATKGLPEAFHAWREANARPQRQAGYAMVTITCPLGDLSADQTRDVADLAREFAGDSVRATVEQNLLLRWVPESDLPEVWRRLDAIGLAEPSAGTIVDVTSCPGTDTCKLGHASSRGLAGELRTRLAARNATLDQAVKELRIKVSGCFNSCGQHHVADIGFYGVGRKANGFMVPHFQVVLGGQWTQNAASFGLAIGAVPSKNVPATVEHLTQMYVDGREPGESFQAFVQRVGRAAIKKSLAPLQKVPLPAEDRSYYQDWGDAREYTTGDLGIGECAGEVVSATEFGLAEAERQAFDAQVHYEEGRFPEAAALALEAMVTGARALLAQVMRDVPQDQADAVAAFREKLYETKLAHDPFAGPKFLNYLFRQLDEDRSAPGKNQVHHWIEEAQLFIEAMHGAHGRMSQPQAAE